MTTIPLPNNPTSGGDATYDAWGRLVKLEDGADTVAEYEYDGLGRRIIKHVYDAGSGTFDYSDHSYYNGWQVIEVRRDTDSTKGGDPDADPMEVFVYHPYYIDAVAVRYWDDPDDVGGLDGTWARHYYLHDAQYNVIAIVDDANTILERYRYAPYGEQTVMDASYSVKTGGTDYGQYVGFTGQRLDPESGLVYMRNRYWLPPLGVFVTVDPFGYPNGMNRFAGYFAMHSGMDPYGLEAKIWTFAGINNVDTTTGRFVDYVAGWAKGAGLTVDLETASRAGTTEWYLDHARDRGVFYARGVRSRAQLNADARWVAQKFAFGLLCRKPLDP